MSLSLSGIAGFLALMAVSAVAWFRRRNVGGKTWAFRIIPPGIVLLCLVVCAGCDFPLRCFSYCILALFAVYALSAYWGGWRLSRPRNRVLRGVWWLTHVIVYFTLISAFCAVLAGVVGFFVATHTWTIGRVTETLPFAVEYKRAKTMCAEYDKRLLFKSGKRIGLPMDTCGFGPFQVYRLKSGDYCLVDGYDRKHPKSFGDQPSWLRVDQSRWLRVNIEKETVELKEGIGWFKIPEEGYVRGWGGCPDDLSHFRFDMYPGGNLNNKGWHVTVSGTPVGDSLDGKKLIGTINTAGQFRSL